MGRTKRRGDIQGAGKAQGQKQTPIQTAGQQAAGNTSFFAPSILAGGNATPITQAAAKADARVKTAKRQTPLQSKTSRKKETRALLDALDSMTVTAPKGIAAVVKSELSQHSSAKRKPKVSHAAVAKRQRKQKRIARGQDFDDRFKAKIERAGKKMARKAKLKALA